MVALFGPGVGELLIMIEAAVRIIAEYFNTSLGSPTRNKLGCSCK